MAEDVDVNKIARATGGYTGAQLMAVMNTAAISAVRRGSRILTTNDMLNVRTPIRPPPPHSKQFSFPLISHGVSSQLPLNQHKRCIQRDA